MDTTTKRTQGQHLSPEEQRVVKSFLEKNSENGVSTLKDTELVELFVKETGIPLAENSIVRYRERFLIQKKRVYAERTNGKNNASLTAHIRCKLDEIEARLSALEQEVRNGN